MNAYAIYNRTVVGTIAVFLCAIVATLLYIEVQRGDLTRLGGYLENDFGWNAPQETFESPLFSIARSLSEYDRYYDVLVVGDSFSQDSARGWQNYLAAKTGWSILTFNMIQVPLTDVIRSSTYQTTPPRLLIYESVERNIIQRHPSCEPTDNTSRNSHKLIKLPVNSLGVTPVFRDRTRRALNSETLDPSRVFNFWKKAGTRTFFNRNLTEVHEFELESADLFSNRLSSHMLVITRDFMLQGVTDEQIRIAQCDLVDIQKTIETTGETAFLALIFPDKTSVYESYITDQTYSNMSIASEMENTTGLSIAKIKNDFDAAVKNGVVDFYLPNDTHCGFYGYRLAADAVLDVLSDRELIAY